MTELVHEALFGLLARRGAVPRPSSAAVCNDESRLVPAFRARLDLVLEAMRAEGHDPKVFETFRSLERAKELADRGVGVSLSMHCYGLAADVISKRMLWSAPSSFWISLRNHAEENKLTSGARFLKRHDLPHVQAVPISAQATVREHKIDDRAFMESIAENYLGR